jgi:hypothetical protein
MNTAIAVPKRVKLEDGKEYTFTKIGLDALAEFNEWTNERNKRPIGHPIDIGETLDAVMTFDGMRWMLWRSLQDNHPEVELKTVGKLLGPINELEGLMGQLLDLPENEEGSDPQKGESP